VSKFPNIRYRDTKGRPGVHFIFNDNVSFSEHDFLKWVGYFGLAIRSRFICFWMNILAYKALVIPEVARAPSRHSINYFRFTGNQKSSPLRIFMLLSWSLNMVNIGNTDPGCTHVSGGCA